MSGDSLGMDINVVKGENIPLVPRIDIPTIYADGIRGLWIWDNVVRMQLVEHRVDQLDDTMKAVPVATIGITLPQMVAWRDFFNQIVEKMSEAGHIP